MTGQGSDAASVIYMEVEGIKIAIRLAADAARIAGQLTKYLLSSGKAGLEKAKYGKVYGKTNRKNFIMRASGQAVIPAGMDKKTFQLFAKEAGKAGILFTAYKPLKSGKRDSMQVMILEKDLAIFQDIISRIKEKTVREDVKNGMEEEQAGKEFDDTNRMESMEEFTENVGAATDADVFDADMKEEFGENYEEEIHFPKQKTAGINKEKVGALADIIQFTERRERMRKECPVEVGFVYDAAKEISQITEQTETHVKIEGEDLLGKNDGWKALWVPKSAIDPPLDREPGEGGRRTARLSRGETVVIYDPSGNELPTRIKGEELLYHQNFAPEEIAEEMGGYRRTAPKRFDITINKNTLFVQENERAVKTRVPGTWGHNARYLWISRKDMRDVYGGKSVLTFLEADKEYKLRGADGNVVETVSGSRLYQEHYDPVRRRLREETGIPAQKGIETAVKKGRGRTL